MSLIQVSTQIRAPRERVFDLARSVDAHVASTTRTGERVVDGRLTGLLELGEIVTWEARHFGIRQRLTAKVTRFDRPSCFEDEMLAGAFKSLRHRHSFHEIGANRTEMIDLLDFRAPLGVVGRAAELVFLTRYMRRFLVDRNQSLTQIAESDAWSQFLPTQ